MNQIQRLLNYFKQFEVLDLIAFGNILGVEEKDPFEDYVVDICEKFQQESRFKRRQLLKLAKDVAAANKNLKA